jgi:large subunit ribosomal protein L28
MAQRCDVCEKGPSVGHKISHAHNVTKRRWLANLVSMRGKIGTAGVVQRARLHPPPKVRGHRRLAP